MNDEEIRAADIHRKIGELSGHLDEVLDGLVESHYDVRVLIGTYAIEYTEGASGADIKHHLESAMRSVRAAVAIHESAARSTVEDSGEGQSG